MNAIDLDAAGLYPILVATLGLLSFGAADLIGGNGFLSIYLTGIVMGNRPLVFRNGILLFHDGTAWMSQIAMFVILGMLSFPSALLAAAPQGLLVAGVLTFVARPLTIFLLMPWFGFNRRELTLLSWVGLEGAVPIILAIYPLLSGVPDGRQIFDLVFFTVLVSALTQGWSLPAVANRLGLQAPWQPEPAVSLETTSLKRRMIEPTVASRTLRSILSATDLARPRPILRRFRSPAGPRTVASAAAGTCAGHSPDALCPALWKPVRTPCSRGGAKNRY